MTTDDSQLEVSEPLKSEYPHLLFLIVAAVTLNILYWLLTNPITGGPKVVLGALFLIFLLFYACSLLLCVVTFKLLKYSASGLRQKSIAVMIAVGSVVLVGLRSLNQLGVADVVLVLLLELIVAFYFLRRF